VLSRARLLVSAHSCAVTPTLKRATDTDMPVPLNHLPVDIARHLGTAEEVAPYSFSAAHWREVYLPNFLRRREHGRLLHGRSL
jgi:hypothetical protein